MDGERTVFGLSCSQVLALLSDYLDHDLAASQQECVEGHLRGCEGCARFGGAFSATVRALREQLAGPQGAPPSVRTRLLEALRGESGRGEPG